MVPLKRTMQTANTLLKQLTSPLDATPRPRIEPRKYWQMCRNAKQVTWETILVMKRLALRKDVVINRLRAKLSTLNTSSIYRARTRLHRILTPNLPRLFLCRKSLAKKEKSLITRLIRLITLARIMKRPYLLVGRKIILE